MELDELKTAWTRMESRLDNAETLVLRDVRERKLDKSRSALRRVGWGQAAQILIWTLVIAIVAPFWIEHRETPHLLGAGLVLHAYGVITICLSVLQVLMIGRINYSAPVLTIQRQLAELHRFRIRTTMLLGLPWWLLWIPCTMVGAMWLFGIDLYAESPGWIHVSLAIGVAGMLLTVWLARRLADRPPSSGTLRRLIDDMASCSLPRAAREMDDLARFERE